ncbi:MAG: hypothetical protein PUB98_05710 [Clostridiales bacterium]|nr:hypothetical protein [Clostridiales bacterium]
MQEKKNVLDKFKLLNPKNLEKEVDAYGYHFSWKSHTMLILGALVAIGAVGYLFRLRPLFFTLLVGAAICALPVLVLDLYRKMYEQKRFADVSAYMEQMLYSFQKTGKINGALKETREIFQAGQMHQTLEAAISHLEKGKADTKEGVLWESLQMIEEQYGCPKLRMVHKLLLSTEEYGGDIERSILLLLEDIERWKKRGYRLQAEKKKSHTDNMISIGVAVGLCALALSILQRMQGMFDRTEHVSVFQLPLIQISSVLFFLFLIRVFVKSARSLTDNWLEEKGQWEEAYLLKSYLLVTEYNEAKEKRKSMLFTTPCLIGAGIFFLLEIRVGGLIFLLLSAFFLIQHKMGYAIAKKDVTNSLYQELPQWLMEITLLLQTNNVQVSLMKSVQAAGGVLRRELEKLMERLSEAPGSLCAYTSFAEGFDLPEASSCMKILHAVSEMGAGNVEVQMSHLLERVQEMQNRADDMKNESIAFRMKLIFSYPVIAATAKLMLDLAVGMVVMFQVLGNMGGV